MRNITSEAVNAFNSNSPFCKSNSSVTVHEGVTRLALYGHVIAWKQQSEPQLLTVATCGFNTTTTKERLNGLDGVSVNTNKGQLYLNGNKWDGEPETVKL